MLERFYRAAVVVLVFESIGIFGAPLMVMAQESPGIAVASGPAFSGSWTYRSYVNNPDQTVEPNNLLFGMATLVLEEGPNGTLSGSIGGSGWQLTVSGRADYSATAATAKFQGVGTIGGERWVYDYFGYMGPVWANGVDQVPSIVGVVVRTAPHGGAQAGFAASFIAVRQP